MRERVLHPTWRRGVTDAAGRKKAKAEKARVNHRLRYPVLLVGFEGAEAGLDDAVVVAYIIVDFIRGFFRLSFTPY
jgi:hypothetical protein